MARYALDDLPKVGLAIGGLVAWVVTPPYPRDGKVADVPFTGPESLGPIVENAMRPFVFFVITAFALGAAFTLALHFGIRHARARLSPRAGRAPRAMPAGTASMPARTGAPVAPACPGRSAVSTTLANIGVRAASGVEARTKAGLLRIDHLALVGSTVVVVEVVHLAGTVSGGPDRDTWVHRRAGGSERTFGNPVVSAEAKARAVRALVPAGLRVAALAMMTGPATLPAAGDRLTSLSRLAGTLARIDGGADRHDAEDAFAHLARGLRGSPGA